jgi:hypothetical protein
MPMINQCRGYLTAKCHENGSAVFDLSFLLFYQNFVQALLVLLSALSVSLSSIVYSLSSTPNSAPQIILALSLTANLGNKTKYGTRSHLSVPYLSSCCLYSEQIVHSCSHKFQS